MIYIIVFLFLFLSNSSYSQNYPNIENQMLSNSLNSFLYYESKDPVPFSDPRSLMDTEYRAQLSDAYHDSLYDYQNKNNNSNMPDASTGNYQFNVINVINITNITKRYNNPYKFRIP